MDNYCKHCGEKLTPGQEHDCPKKITWNKIKAYILKIVNKIGPNEDVDESEWFEKGKSIVPDVVDQNDGEITVKQYDVAILRSRLKGCEADGKMQITNKRILFRAAGKSLIGRTVYQSEFDISHIEGIEVCKDYRFMWLDLFIALAIFGLSMGLGRAVGAIMTSTPNVFLCFLTIPLGVATSIPFFIMRKHYKTKMFSAGVGISMLISMIATVEYSDNNFLLVLGLLGSLALFYIAILFFIAMFFSCFQPNLAIVVQSSTAASAVKAVAVYSGYDEVLPSNDTDLVIKEIGAVINDIKTLGDFGVEKWKTK